MRAEIQLDRKFTPEITLNEKMSKHTSLGVGGRAKYFAVPDSFKAFQSLTAWAKLKGVPVKIIGNGTNLLFSDNGFDGLVISMKKFTGVKLLGKRMVVAYAGENLKTLINFTQKKNLSGLEELSGIPATVGGAIYQNAGAFEKSISDNLFSVKVYDKKVYTLKKEDCQFDYRTSVFKKHGGIILSATFNLTECDERQILAKINRITAKRKEKQPTGKTCGSVFINPNGKSAGELIEKSGLKGFSVGKARVSEKHANFIINNGNSAEDVFLLIEYVKRTVYKKQGVKLKEEVEKVGIFT